MQLGELVSDPAPPDPPRPPAPLTETPLPPLRPTGQQGGKRESGCPLPRLHAENWPRVGPMSGCLDPGQMLSSQHKGRCQLWNFGGIASGTCRYFFCPRGKCQLHRRRSLGRYTCPLILFIPRSYETFQTERGPKET